MGTNNNTDNTNNEIDKMREDLQKKIAFYESQLASTIDQTQRGILVCKINSAKKEIKKLTTKPAPVKKIKRRAEDPVLCERKKNKNDYDGRGSVINTGSGTYSFLI